MITITERAAAEVKRFIRQHGGADAARCGLRLRVTGGGCDGLQHELEIDRSCTADDASFEVAGIRIVVDRTSLPLLDGAEIDYVETAAGQGFTVRCADPRGPCGCGAPFRC